MNSQHIINRLGETDQLYLQDNQPTLALERGNLRLQLVSLSRNKAEQIYFLQEAVAILEQARIEFEEMPLELYLKLSIQLAKAYMLYFELEQQQHFALITQQILKPLAHYAHGDVYFLLAYAAISKQELAFTRHWLQKYVQSNAFDLEFLQKHHAFITVQKEDWFKTLVAKRLH